MKPRPLGRGDSLSHVGEKAVDIDLTGAVHGVFPLKEGLQFEGLTFDGSDNLLFISEPNLIYKYRRSP